MAWVDRDPAYPVVYRYIGRTDHYSKYHNWNMRHDWDDGYLWLWVQLHPTLLWVDVLLEMRIWGGDPETVEWKRIWVPKWRPFEIGPLRQTHIPGDDYRRVHMLA